MAVARRESTCSGGSSGGVAFCQGDWDVNSQGRERERLATGIVGHFELWLRVGLLKRRGYLSNARGNPGCLGVRLSCFGAEYVWAYVLYVMYAAAESCVQAGGGGTLAQRVRYAGGEGNTIQD